MKINYSFTKLSLVVLASIMSLTACSFLYFYRSINELPGMQWEKKSVQTFEVIIEKDIVLDGIFVIRHVYGFSYPEIKVSYKLSKDGEDLENRTMTVPIKDQHGDYVGEGSVDLWDVNYPFFENVQFEPGTYVFQFSHEMQRDPLPLIMDVGLILEKE